jgi:hypothetical protein
MIKGHCSWSREHFLSLAGRMLGWFDFIPRKPRLRDNLLKASHNCLTDHDMAGHKIVTDSPISNCWHPLEQSGAADSENL